MIIKIIIFFVLIVVVRDNKLRNTIIDILKSSTKKQSLLSVLNSELAQNCYSCQKHFKT